MYTFILFLCLVFFVKQKTAYEMRISDWSSDVCSSDLVGRIQGNYDKKFKVSIVPVDLVAQIYQKKIVIAQAEQFSNIVNISLDDPIQAKARDILNSLIFTYNDNAIEDRKQIADKTSEFIDDRLYKIYSNLSSTDQTISEERRVGKECVRTYRTRMTPLR